MSLYKQFRTDKSVETAGVWLEYGENDQKKPVRIRVARAGGANERYSKVLDRITKPVRRSIQAETLPPAQVRKLIIQAYAESIVLGWENVDLEASENGPEVKDAPFTKENAVRLFTDLPDLFDDVQEQSRKAALFQQDILEVSAKN